MIKDYSKSSILQQTFEKVTFERSNEQSYQIIDVRSQKEFTAGSIPGAVNIPLFGDDERAEIGTLYRHVGHHDAVERGFEYVEMRLSSLVDSFLPYKKSPLTIFCAKGGMRSRSVVNLLRQFRYDAYQLEGGYKKYRHDVLECLGDFHPKLIVVHGLTGTGKTRILQHLDNIIDLEDLAQHRSSLFGAIDRIPRNQREFESHLFQVIQSLGKEPHFIEGESRKIGRVFIPKSLAMAMKEGIYVKVNCSMETRIKRIIEDYPVADKNTLLELERILKSLRRKMGQKEVDRLCSLLNQGDLDGLVRALLLGYYDKRYGNCMNGYRYEFELSSEDIGVAVAELAAFRDSLT